MKISIPLLLVCGLNFCTWDSYSQIPTTGLQVWFRADSLVTYNVSTGAVSQWEESSANKKKATQATGSQQPTLVQNAINGKPAIYFNGYNTQYFTTNYTFPSNRKEFTFFIVAKCANPQSIVSFYTSPNFVAYPYTDNGPSNGLIISTDGGNNDGIATGLTGIDYEIGTAWYDGGGVTNGIQTYQDTVLVAERNSGSTVLSADAFYIGAYGGFTQYTTGYVAEIIVYDTSLTAAQRTTVQNYLISKYAINLPYISIKSGNWTDPTVWNKDAVPSSSSDVVIDSNVTVNTSSAACNGLYVNSSGSLVIPATESLSLGTAGGGNNVVNNCGKLTLAGTLNLNGNYETDNSAGDLIMQTGGNLNIDGNSGTASTSVPDGYSLINLTQNAIRPAFNSNSTGGTITIVDPPYGATSNTLNIPSDGDTGYFNNNVRLQLGNGVSTTSGVNTNGFNLFGYWQFGSLVVNNPSGTNRQVTMTEPIGIYDSLVIDAGELTTTDFTVYINGPVLNNGTLIAYSLQEAAAIGSGTGASLAQSIGGTGLYEDNVSPDAETHNLYVNNSSGQGTTINLNDYTVNTLTLNAGLVNLGSDTLICESAPSQTGSSPWINTNGTGSLEIESVGNSNVIFPVGTSTDFDPVTIDNTGTSDNFFVSVGSTISDPSGVTPSLNRQWAIGESLKGQGSNMNLTLQWNSSVDGSGFSNTNAGISYYNGVTWQGKTGTITGANPYKINASGFPANNSYTVSDNPQATPITLLYFAGSLVKTQTLLTWETLTELNNKYFEVERSYDGYNFNALGTVAGQGTSSSPHDYSFVDAAPLPGLNYYRLKQVDEDGNWSFSPIISVLAGEGHALGIYPNPTMGPVNIQLPSRQSGQSALVSIYNMAGQPVRLIKAEAGSSLISQDLSSLPAGVYLLQVTYEDNYRETLKFIKQ